MKESDEIRRMLIEVGSGTAEGGAEVALRSSSLILFLSRDLLR